MKRKREMRAAMVGEMDELAKTHGSEDSKKSSDDKDRMREFGNKREGSPKEDVKVAARSDIMNGFKYFPTSRGVCA
jgi:hypothetical protein